MPYSGELTWEYDQINDRTKQKQDNTPNISLIYWLETLLAFVIKKNKIKKDQNLFNKVKVQHFHKRFDGVGRNRMGILQKIPSEFGHQYSSCTDNPPKVFYRLYKDFTQELIFIVSPILRQNTAGASIVLFFSLPFSSWERLSFQIVSNKHLDTS